MVCDTQHLNNYCILSFNRNVYGACNTSNWNVESSFSRAYYKRKTVNIQDQLGSWCYTWENIHKIFCHREHKYESRSWIGVSAFFSTWYFSLAYVVQINTFHCDIVQYVHKALSLYSFSHSPTLSFYIPCWSPWLSHVLTYLSRISFAPI